MALCEGVCPGEVEIALPDASRVLFAVIDCRIDGEQAEAAVRKDAGDDPDVTHLATIVASVAFLEGNDVLFAAGEGVGTVTKPGLSIPPGEPAINPGPRQMIGAAIREVTQRGVKVRISIPGGRELAERTFNPKLGIEGGLSIIGTTGIVKPFSAPAMEAALKCALDVAAASGVREPVLVPGNIGERAARRHFQVDTGQVVQVSNHWGFMLDEAARKPFARILVVGHPGKLAKLINGDWDTHSSSSGSAVETVAGTARTVLRRAIPESATVEGVFESLPAEERAGVAGALSESICKAIRERIGSGIEMAVVLISMAGDILGSNGDLSPWRK
jgi:cobalt-precorrin-5B (C1)-methyltransferase